jgi:hypothetical protein
MAPTQKPTCLVPLPLDSACGRNSQIGFFAREILAGRESFSVLQNDFSGAACSDIGPLFRTLGLFTVPLNGTLNELSQSSVGLLLVQGDQLRDWVIVRRDNDRLATLISEVVTMYHYFCHISLFL